MRSRHGAPCVSLFFQSTTILLSIVAAGCSLAPAPNIPAAVTEATAEWDSAETDPEDAPEPIRWWENFDDPLLDDLVNRVLAANLDLRGALARLEELRQRYQIARAPLLPAIALDVNRTETSTPANTGLGAQFGGEELGGFGFQFPERFAFTTWSASLAVSYELDFWGRLRNQSGAALREFLATRADAETVRLQVIGSTISTYLELVSTRHLRELAEQDVGLLTDREQTASDAYAAGLVPVSELYAVRQRLRAAENNLASLETATTDVEGRLGILLARPSVDLSAELPTAIGDGPVGEWPEPRLPASLLEGRPDVIAAAQRMDAARLLVGARRAELLPTVSFNGAVGLQASEPQDVLDFTQWFRNLVTGLVAPIFQGGRLRANLGVARAQYDAAVVQYIRTVLTAHAEVNTSLSRFAEERERHRNALEAAAEARDSYQRARDSYLQGAGEYAVFVDAGVSLNSVLAAQAMAVRSLGEARLGVHRALGGTWLEEDVESPTTLGSK